MCRLLPIIRIDDVKRYVEIEWEASFHGYEGLNLFEGLEWAAFADRKGRAVGLEVVRQRRIRTVRKRFVRSIDWR